MDTQTKLYFGATVALIAVSLFCSIIKWFYRPKAYREELDKLFPGRFYTGLLFFLQILELPYLFDLNDPRALRYSNAFSLLLAPPIMMLICNKFFFPKEKNKIRDIYFFIPAIMLFIVFLLRIPGILTFSEVGKAIVINSAFVVFVIFLILTVRMALRIGKVNRAIVQLEYADADDFPKTFATYMQWVPTILCVMAAVNYISHNAWVKFTFDIIYIIASIAFVMFTLDPVHEVKYIKGERVLENIEQLVVEKSKYRMSDSRYERLKGNLMKLFDEEHIYLEQHLSLDMLLKRLSTNRNYLCEAIIRIGYKSFYDMVNTYRVRCAINLIKTEPDSKIFDIAMRSGFSSATSMNKAFKQLGLPVPSSHRGLPPPPLLKVYNLLIISKMCDKIVKKAIAFVLSPFYMLCAAGLPVSAIKRNARGICNQ